MREFYHPPPELMALEREELQALARVLSKLAPGDPVESQGAAQPPVRRRNGDRPATQKK
jgi:hypothetical protein